MEYYGKIPPQAIKAEEALLATLILLPDEIATIDLLPKMFYKTAHQKLFEALQEMSINNELIDIITLQNRKEKDDWGGDSFILKLTESADTTANAEQIAEIIKEKYISRELIRIGYEISKKSFDNDNPFDIISETQQLLSDLSGVKATNTHHISESLIKLHKIIENNYNGNFELTGIPTGFVKFDRIASGLQKSDMIVVAAETSQGKTSLALNITSNAAKLGYKIAIYSYEMSDTQLSARLVSNLSGISSSDIQYKKLEDSAFIYTEKAIQKLMRQNIFIDDVPVTNFDYLEKAIRSIVLKEKIDLVVIDYLQLIRIPGKKLTEGTADIANGLKGLAKSMNIPIILLSQLSRDKNNPKPSIGRLKNSGDIEASADVIWLIYRPDYYGIQEFECDGNTYQSNGLAQMMIAKGRNIPTFEFVTYFNKSLTRFEEYNEQQQSIDAPY